MKKALIVLLILTNSIAFAQHKKILIISTNRDSVGVDASGTYLKEIAIPFRYFKKNNYQIDILTPKGGKAAIYGKATDDLKDVVNDYDFIEKTKNTLSPNQILIKDYEAVFIPGGHGQYFDVVNDERVASIIAQVYEKKGLIGTAGHGVASLINVQLKNGKYLIAGKKMTCFPTWAEKSWMNISGFGKYLAFDMQEVMERRGANLTISDKSNYNDVSVTVITDTENRLITGAFAFNAQLVAERMVEMLSKKHK